MKNSNALGLMAFAMAMHSTVDSDVFSGRGKVSKKNTIEKPIKKPTPFNKQEGVLKMIKEYNLIAKGESKKGIIKQNRVKTKVDKWLIDGWLSEKDLCIK